MAERVVEQEDVIVGQLWIAFAKGAGDMDIAKSAVESMLENFGGLRSGMVEQWPAHGNEILALAFSLGQQAAAAAAAEGSELIEARHVEPNMPSVRMACPC
jgi:hypothetical protein